VNGHRAVSLPRFTVDGVNISGFADPDRFYLLFQKVKAIGYIQTDEENADCFASGILDGNISG
jgi:hypothetical protein